MAKAPWYFQLDEFPYASTKEGGPLALATPVPAWENATQGGLLSAFYRYSLQGGLLSAFYRYSLKGVNPPTFLVVPLDI